MQTAFWRGLFTELVFPAFLPFKNAAVARVVRWLIDHLSVLDTRFEGGEVAGVGRGWETVCLLFPNAYRHAVGKCTDSSG